MKILVTGGCGFIGSNFISYWLNKYNSDTIINLDALTYAGSLNNTLTFKDNLNYKFIHGDICDYGLVNSLVKEVDCIVHFAAESHVDRSIKNPFSFVNTNVVGTFNLLESARNNGLKRFHHISTDEVFGSLDVGSGLKFNETTKYDPRSPYSSSKAASDHLVRSYFHTYGLPITITNCSNNYGPNQSVEKFIPRSITELLLGRKIKIYGSGYYYRDWLHVLDHCSAIDTVLSSGRIGDTYLVGGLTDDISNLDIANTLLDILKKDPSNLELVKDRPGHDVKYAVDWSKINKELGWSPKYDLKTGLVETVSWYTDNKSLWLNAKDEAEDFYDKK